MATEKLAQRTRCKAQAAAERAYADLKAAKEFARRERKRARRRAKRMPSWQLPNGRINYRAYIDSAEWQAKRLEFIAAVDGKCETCGTSRRLQVHHRHYKTLGQETQKDVKVQCWRCHQNTHERDGIKQDDPLSKEFMAIVGA